MVYLVSGPTALPAPSGVAVVRVESALEMEAAVFERIDDCDLFVAAAAVADYRPETVADAKIKKHQDALALRLVKNPDILARVAALSSGPFTVGFAAETEALEEHARAKLQSKGLDMIAANRVGAEQGGFERDENALTVFWAKGRQEFPLMSKLRLAQSVAELIAERYHAQITGQDSGSQVG
jgi:phosphopantothenoylcysteine decarboxylase/phosphopantothenate--cysteine ligase